jgi:hypothetical protein
MNTWAAEPLWETHDRLMPPVQIAASDTLTPVVIERAALPRRVGGTYRGLDRLRVGLKAGVPGAIIRR